MSSARKIDSDVHFGELFQTSRKARGMLRIGANLLLIPRIKDLLGSESHSILIQLVDSQ